MVNVRFLTYNENDLQVDFCLQGRTFHFVEKTKKYDFFVNVTFLSVLFGELEKPNFRMYVNTDFKNENNLSFEKLNDDILLIRKCKPSSTEDVLEIDLSKLSQFLDKCLFGFLCGKHATHFSLVHDSLHLKLTLHIFNGDDEFLSISDQNCEILNKFFLKDEYDSIFIKNALGEKELFIEKKDDLLRVMIYRGNLPMIWTDLDKDKSEIFKQSFKKYNEFLSLTNNKVNIFIPE